jgi:tetratricopeptide (TPR) repeat protein
VSLRFVITIETEMVRAKHVSVELMDAMGSGAALNRRETDDNGTVEFQTLSGVHQVRITGPGIQPYEGEVDVTPAEMTHMERIRVRRAATSDTTAPSGVAAPVPAVRLHIPEAARKAFEKGMEAMHGQKWEQGRTQFESAIKEYPDYDEAYLNLGVVQGQLKDVEGARRSFSKAVELNPDFAEANRNLARILLAEHNNDEALRLLKRSLGTEPNNAWALLNAAYLELQAKSFEQALADAQHVHQLAHENLANAHMVAGYAAQAMAQPEVAEKEFRLYLKEDPDGPNSKRAREAVAKLTASKHP